VALFYRRHRKRAATLHGDYSGAPLSIIRPYPERAPDVSAQPLEIMWRMSPLYAIMFGIVFGLVALEMLTIVAVAPLILLASQFAPWIAPSFVDQTQYGQPLSGGEITATAVLGALTLGAIVLIAWFSARFGPILFGKPYGLRATATGIEQFTLVGGRKRIAWNEMRLFEVARGRNPATAHIFTLYAPKKVVSWVEYRSSAITAQFPVGATEIENALRTAALVNLIAARAGLEPRTLDSRLERAADVAPEPAPVHAPQAQPNMAPAIYPPTPDIYVEMVNSSAAPTFAQTIPLTTPDAPVNIQQQARNRRALTLFQAGLALFLLAVAGAETFAPLTSFALANWPSVAALALLGIFCLRQMFRTVRPRRLSPTAPVGPPQVTRPTSEHATDNFAFCWRSPTSAKSWVLFSGLLLVFNLIPIVVVTPHVLGAWFGNLSAPFTSGANPPTETPILPVTPANLDNPLLSALAQIVDTGLLCLLTVIGFIGVMWVIRALRAQRKPGMTIRVDANGVTWLSGVQKPTFVFWGAIQEVIWTPRGVGDAPSYILRSTDALQIISWPTSPRYIDQTLTPADARPIGSDELAALIAARIGRPMRVTQ
jgi:hypothetical protein